MRLALHRGEANWAKRERMCMCHLHVKKREYSQWTMEIIEQHLRSQRCSKVFLSFCLTHTYCTVWLHKQRSPAGYWVFRSSHSELCSWGWATVWFPSTHWELCAVWRVSDFNTSLRCLGGHIYQSVSEDNTSAGHACTHARSLWFLELFCRCWRWDS